MQIISHRGYWKNTNEMNMPVAFERSFRMGYGTETDLRDYNGSLVISHDIASNECMSAKAFFELLLKYDNKLTIALNIKSDGLQDLIRLVMEELPIQNYFVFDMSIPDMVQYNKLRIPFFSRQSEYEKNVVFYEECHGVWLDAFESIWYDIELIVSHINKGKKVAIVSPDLHKREVWPLWHKLKDAKINEVDNVLLCTDIPQQAKNFFN